MENEIATRIDILINTSLTSGTILDYASLLKTTGTSHDPPPNQSGTEQETDEPDSEGGTDTHEPTAAKKTIKRKSNHEEMEYDYEDDFIDDSDEVRDLIFNKKILNEILADESTTKHMGFFCWSGDVETYLQD